MASRHINANLCLSVRYGRTTVVNAVNYGTFIVIEVEQCHYVLNMIVGIQGNTRGRSAIFF